jgi:hypothetical protein
VLALLEVLVGGVPGAASSWQVSVGGCVKRKILTGGFSLVCWHYIDEKKEIKN